MYKICFGIIAIFALLLGFSIYFVRCEDLYGYTDQYNSDDIIIVSGEDGSLSNEFFRKWKYSKLASLVVDRKVSFVNYEHYAALDGRYTISIGPSMLCDGRIYKNLQSVESAIIWLNSNQAYVEAAFN